MKVSLTGTALSTSCGRFDKQIRNHILKQALTPRRLESYKGQCSKINNMTKYIFSATFRNSHVNSSQLNPPSFIKLNFDNFGLLSSSVRTFLTCLFLTIISFYIPNLCAQTCGCSSFQVIGFDENSVTDFSSITLTTGYCLDVRGTLYIDTVTEWDGLIVIMRESSVIIVEADFSVINGTHITGCGTMWQGIHTTGSGKVTLTDCIIEGAEFGVKLVNLQEIKCQNVQFIDDYIGIAAGNPFDNDDSSIKILQDGQITGCTFYTDGYLPDPYPTQYYEGDWPPAQDGIIYRKMYAAVFMKNCVGLGIGDRTATGSDWNEVYEARNGVIMINSNSYIAKTDFHGFTGQFPDGLIQRPSLLRINQVAIYSDRSVARIEWNKTEDVMVGLWGQESSDYVTENEFGIYNEDGGEANTKGIHEQRPQNLTIVYNKINNGYIGIWVDNGTRPFTINNNYLERFVDRENNEGIRIDGYHVLGTVTAKIYDNTLEFDNSESVVGISMQFVTGIKVDYNLLIFDATVAEGKHNLGIYLLDGTSCVISRNVITADPDYNNETSELADINVGIAILNSKLTTLHCNDMENFDNDIWIIGTNNITYISSNFFGDANRGLEIYGPSRLGIQRHKGNQWLGEFDEWGAIVTGGDLYNTAEYSKFIVDASDLGGIFIPDSYDPENLFVDQEGFAHTCVQETSQLNPNGIELSAFIREDFEFTRFDEEMKWMAYADLYDILLKHDSLLTYYALDSFFAVKDLEALGGLMKIRDNLSRIPSEQFSTKLVLDTKLKLLTDDLIEIDSIITLNPMDKLDWVDLRGLKCDTMLDTLEVWIGLLDNEMEGFLVQCEDALTDLSGVTTTNDLEEYLKQTLRMRASLTLDGYLSSGDSTDISDMRELCPWLGGYAIGLDYDIFAEITDSVAGHKIYPCLSSEPLSPSEDLNKNSHTDLLVSPNPTCDQINIQSVTEISQIKLFDSTSKLVFNAYPNQDTYTIDVKNLNPGIYILNTIQGKVVHTIKIVVTR